MKYIKEFFRNDHPFIPFKPFGFIHCICISLVIITLIIIYINRNKISNMNEKTKKRILKTTAIIMLVNMIIYNIAPHLFGYFDYKIHLPFQLCFISGYMFMYGILFEKEWILKLTLFLSFIGPIPAILWPDMPSTIDDFNFWKYFISHHVFICISFFSYFTLNYKITKKDILKAFIFANCLILIMMPFNHIFKMNYIYSSEIPHNIVEMYPFIENFPPFLTIEVTGLIIAIVLYQLIRKRNLELEMIEQSNIQKVNNKRTKKVSKSKKN